ncbi:hypothetical protein GP486_001928 [Trichoglossum hirsutum]|uniref:SNF2 N-terminal domain-containing protein n=1 Tax=Trichoglossum hirsutum TaxID=265104 RepID=A0A9P8LFX2_9PEZI|nr:hypothetical protein GP486_001928 [Trichoglossum hirsutum]
MEEWRMSNSKRLRTTEWAVEPPNKRVLYQSENQDYQTQNLWQAWPENPESSYLSQNSTPNIAPAIELFSCHPTRALQGQQDFSNDLYHTGEQLFYPDAQQFAFNPSASAEYSHSAFGEAALTAPSNDLAMESILGRASDAAETSNLCDVKVQLDEGLDAEYLDMEGLNFLELVTEIKTFLTLQVSFYEQYCVLQTKEGRTFGVLNKRTFRSLTTLSCFKELNYTALVGCDDWKERSFVTNKDSKLRCMYLDINVSGPRYVLDTVAKELSRVGLFLQPPPQGTTVLPYENPQYLHLPGVVQVEEISLFSGSQAPSVEAPVPGRQQAMTSNERLLDFDMIIEELPRHEYLKEAVTDFRVKTILLCHQKEGVDFVTRRETLSLPDSRGLWENQSSTKNFQCYQHIITGAKSPTPDDFLGGILADDMGLGKSLTMLSAIVGSLARANEYARQGSMSAGHPGEPPRAAKSTLIIVPSAHTLFVALSDTASIMGKKDLRILLHSLDMMSFSQPMELWLQTLVGHGMS